MKKILPLIIISSSLPILMSAQTDSFAIKEVLLKEVIIQQGAPQANHKNFFPNQNAQMNTDHLLNRLSGLSMVKRGNYAWEPGIRGLLTGRIATTIDGMAIFGACTDKMDPISSYIEPSNLKSVAVSYGLSEQASGNTIGGGLDFKINQPVFSKEKKEWGSASAGYDFNGSGKKILAAYNYSTHKLGVNVNAIYRSSGNYSAGGGETIRFSQFEKWNAGLGVRYKINSHQNLLFNYIIDEGYNIGYPALTMDVLFAKAHIVSLGHNWHIGNGAIQKLESKFYYNAINHAMDDTKRPADEVHMHMDMPGTSSTKGFLSTASGNMKNHSFKLKANFYQNKLHAEMTMYPETGAPMFMLTMPDGARNYYEMSIHDSWQISERFELQTGVSAGFVASSIFSEDGKQAVAGTVGDQLGRQDRVFSLSATPTYRFNDKATGFITIAHAARAPVLHELYGFYLFNRADNFDYLGNTDLKNESSINLSGGVDFRSEKLRWNTKGFVYFINGYIAGVIDPKLEVMTHDASGVKQYQNIGSATLFGLEAEVEWKVHSAIKVTSANSWHRGSDASGNALPSISPFRSIGKVVIQLKGFEVVPEVIFNAAQNHTSEWYGESPSPSSTLFNLSVDRIFKVGKQRFCISGGVQNIFDTRYYDHTDVMKILRPGRNIATQLSWYF